MEIVEAIDAKTNQLDYKLEKREIDPNFLSFARRGQLACLLSHIEVWKRIVNENLPSAIVLEDDAIITERFHTNFPNADFIYLFVHPDSKLKGETEFVKGYKTYGTVGYYLTNKMAKELIEFFSKRIFSTIDDSLSIFLQNKNYYCVGENFVNTAGKLYFHRDDTTELDSNIGQAGLYKDSNLSNLSFSYFFEKRDWLVYPNCTTKDGNIRFEKDLKIENIKEIAFSTDGWVKNKVTKNFKLWNCDLYVRREICKMCSILICGGAGYISSNFIFELIQQKEEKQIIIVDNLSNSSRGVVEKLKLLSDKVIFYDTDIQNEEKMEEIFQYYTIDSVIHFAAFKSVGESVTNPLKYYSNNIGGLLSLLRTMQKYNVYKLIFSSSATVYGNPEKLPLTEDSKTSCLNPYGRTKLFAEEILRDMTNMKIICLRYFNPVGASDKMFRETPKEINNLFPYIISVIRKEKTSLSIYGNDYETKDGTPVRDFLHVKDLCKSHISALKYLDDLKYSKFEIFNIGTGTGFTVLEVVKRFHELGYNFPYKIVDRRVGDAPEVYADCSKAEKLLKWKTELILDDMIKDSL